MSENKIYIGNLAYSSEVAKILEIFSAFGTIIDSFFPERKGYGFITFETAEQAKAAIETMDGKDLDGRNLRVNIAQPKEDKPRRFNNNRFSNRGDSRRRDY